MSGSASLKTLYAVLSKFRGAQSILYKRVGLLQRKTYARVFLIRCFSKTFLVFRGFLDFAILNSGILTSTLFTSYMHKCQDYGFFCLIQLKN